MRRRFTINKGFTETFDFNNYLTIEALEDNFTLRFANNIEYGIDGKGWIKLRAGKETPSINIGQTLSFRGELTPNSSNGIGEFIISKKCNLKGNCMSMLFGDNAANNFSLSGKSYAFYRLFYDCINIINVSSTFLPATTLADYCYYHMFFGCTSLTQAPELPATTLVNQCYDHMFSGCTSLTQAPELPATTLATYCYGYMFYRCTSLVNAPELPATTLGSSCYKSMFYRCTSLVNAPELPATTLASNCYQGMFYDCTSLVNAPELPVTTLVNQCYDHMFFGCTSLVNAPELPATTLADYCYNCMFSGCNSLTTAPELPATTLVSNCYTSMFSGCKKLNYIKAMFTTTPSTLYIYNWVYGVASTGKFIKNKNATWDVTATSDNNYIGIPSGWTVQTA